MRKAVGFVVLLLVGAAVIGHRLWLQPVDVPELSAGQASALGVPVPGFTEIPVDHGHVYRQPNTLPFAGGAVIDIDGDGKQEVFLGGAAGQDDALVTFRNGRFVDVIGHTGLSRTVATYGVLAIDADDDGRTDLIVCRDDGVYLYHNAGNGTFDGRKLPVPLEPNAVPISVTAGDINRDGVIDLYVSTFVNAREYRRSAFNNPGHATRNVLLLGKKGGGFEDATAEAGVEVNQNTYGALFVDLDNDGWLDLVVAENAGHLLLFRNTGDGHFELKKSPTALGFWMSLTAGDYNGDGATDLFASNVGNTVPEFLLRGDRLPGQTLDLQWALLRNDGNFDFTDVSGQVGLADMEFGWGASFADFNLDGRPDLVVTENDFRWPAHRWDPATGRMLLQDPHGRFRPVTRVAGVENSYFGQMPLIADFNGDGYPDLMIVNLDAAPRAFFSHGGGNGFIKVVLPDSFVSVGAQVSVKRADGRILTSQFTEASGFLGDSSPVMIFGLGRAPAAVSIDVTWPRGKHEHFESVQPNTTLRVE